MNRIFFLADLHGDWQPVNRLNKKLIKIKQGGLDQMDTVVLLGDAGVNFYLNERDNQFKNRLDSLKCNYFLIRGNHEARPSDIAADNPDGWECVYDVFYCGKVWREKRHPHIVYAMDYPEVYNFDGYKTLVIPGAYSVDKYYRLAHGWAWFENEQLTEWEKKRGKELVKEHGYFDFILSHTCPLQSEPVDLFISGLDQSTVDKSMEEYLQEIYNMVESYNWWLWGHYHAFRIYSAPEPNGYKGQNIMLFNHRTLELNSIITGAYNEWIPC